MLGNIQIKVCDLSDWTIKAARVFQELLSPSLTRNYFLDHRHINRHKGKTKIKCWNEVRKVIFLTNEVVDKFHQYTYLILPLNTLIWTNTVAYIWTEKYLSSSSCKRVLTVWALFSRVNLCRRKNVCWNIRSRYSSKSIGTQFFDTSSLTQVIASTPSRARSTLLTSPCWSFGLSLLAVGSVPELSCPLDVEEIKGPVLALVRRSQPKRAKWKMDASRVGVMLVDRGIQLNRWAKHSKTRQQSWWLSLSSAAMGWQRSFEYWLPWNKLPSNSTEEKKKKPKVGGV